MINYRGVISTNSVSEYKRFRIGIEGFYGWGVGYYNAMLLKLFEEMIEKIHSEMNEIFSVPVNFAYSNFKGSCNTIKGIDNSSYVYLHPMEFTGYLKDEDIENLYKFVLRFFSRERENDSELGEHPCFRATITFKEEVMALTDEEYIKLIEDSADAILAHTKEALDKLSIEEKKELFKQNVPVICASDFCHTGRIARDTDKAGIGSTDVDWITVEKIIKTALNSGYFEN